MRGVGSAWQVWGGYLGWGAHERCGERRGCGAHERGVLRLHDELRNLFIEEEEAN